MELKLTEKTEKNYKSLFLILKYCNPLVGMRKIYSLYKSKAEYFLNFLSYIVFIFLY